MNKDKDIEQLFQDTFSGFEVNPPPGLKAEIDKKLPFGEPKRRLKYWFFGTSIVLLSLAFLGVYSYLSNPEKGTNGENKGLVSTQDKTNNTPQHATQEAVIDEDIAAAASGSGIKNLPNKNTNFTPKSGDEKPVNTTQDKTPNKKKKPAKNKKASPTKASDLYKKNKRIPKKLAPNKYLAQTKKNGGEEHWKETSSEKGFATNETNSSVENGPKTTDEAASSEETTKKAEPEKLKTDKNAEPEEKTEIPTSEGKQSTPAAKPPVTPPLPLMLSLKSGFSLPFNRFNETNLGAKETGLFNLQLEATYFLNEKIGLSSGINYFRSVQELEKHTTISKTELTGEELLYITKDTFDIFQVDTLPPDTVYYTMIIDSVVNPIYTTYSADSVQRSSFSSSSISIPILFSYSMAFGKHWNLDLMTGGMLHFQQVRFKLSENPVNQLISSTNMGFRFCLKTHVRYQWDHWGVSLSSNFGYDIGSPKFNSSKRQRSVLDVGVGLHYKF